MYTTLTRLSLPFPFVNVCMQTKTLQMHMALYVSFLIFWCPCGMRVQAWRMLVALSTYHKGRGGGACGGPLPFVSNPASSYAGRPLPPVPVRTTSRMMQEYTCVAWCSEGGSRIKQHRKAK